MSTIPISAQTLRFSLFRKVSANGQTRSLNSSTMSHLGIARITFRVRHKRCNQDSLVRLELHALDNFRGVMRPLAPRDGHVVHGGGTHPSSADRGAGDIRD
jgi:hypothetical protein